MGNYANAVDVFQFAARPMNAATTVDREEVDEFVTDIEGIVNAVLRAIGYVPIPATDVDDIVALKNIVMCGAASRLEKALEDFQKAENYREWFDKYLEDLKNGTLLLSGGGVSSFSNPKAGDEQDQWYDRDTEF